jgi:hypothetical protein
MAADYVTVNQLHDHLGLKGDVSWDPKLIQVITGVSRWIDEYCRRHFWQDEATARVFDSCDGKLLRLDVFNDLVSVTEVAVDTARDGTYSDVWATTDFQLLPTQPRPGRPYTRVRAVGRQFPIPTWEGRSGLVRITGTWGWPAIPSQVHEAALVQCARIFKRKDAPEGIIGFDQLGTVRVGSRPDPDVVQMLDPLVHPAAITVT